MFKKIVLLSILFFAAPAIAQEAPPNVPEARSHGTRIVTDEETGTIRFIVEGREAARIDASGLYVRESIEFGGTITDTGTAHFDARAAKSERP